MKTYRKHWPQSKEDLYLEGHGPYTRPALLFLKANIDYRKGKPIMSDQEYDNLESWYKELYPEWPGLQIVGMPTKEQFKEALDWIRSSRSKNVRTR